MYVYGSSEEGGKETGGWMEEVIANTDDTKQVVNVNSSYMRISGLSFLEGVDSCIASRKEGDFRQLFSTNQP